MPLKYKYKGKAEVTIPDVGIVKEGDEVEVQTEIVSPDFELIGSQQTNNVVGIEAAQPNAVANAQPVDPGLEIK